MALVVSTSEALATITTAATRTIRIPKPTITIQVCQNKECCRRFSSSSSSDLVQTLRQLLPPTLTCSNHQNKVDGIMLDNQNDNTLPPFMIQIESTGCLSQCESGPNLRVVLANTNQPKQLQVVTEQKIHSNVDTYLAAATILEESFSFATTTGTTTTGTTTSSTSIQIIPPILLAAQKVLLQATTSTRENNAKEQERFLNSVINALEKDKSTSTLSQSNAMAHALVLRARLQLQQQEQGDALIQQDRNVLVDLQRAAMMDPHHPKVWRSLVDTLMAIVLRNNHHEEAEDDYPKLLHHALIQWQHYQPQFRTKILNIRKELQQHLQ